MERVAVGAIYPGWRQHRRVVDKKYPPSEGRGRIRISCQPEKENEGR